MSRFRLWHQLVNADHPSGGKFMAEGTTVPTDAAVGYRKGCIFTKTNGTTDTTLYINEGTRASCAFVPFAGKMAVSGTAAGKGPSPLIWDACEIEKMMLDPTIGFVYFDDYLGDIDPDTGKGYVVTAVTTGSISGLATAQGGVLKLDSAGSTTADDGVQAQLPNCMVKPAAAVTIYFEARVMMNDATDQYFVGLAGIDTTLIAAGVVDDTVDKCGFYHEAASTNDKISSITARTSADDKTVDVAANADGTYLKLGFVIDGLTSVKFYVNGALVETGTTTASIPNAVMCLSYVSQIEGTGADAELNVDWVRIAQVGGRV